MPNNYVTSQREEINTPKKMNVFTRLGNLIFSPRNLFLFIREKPGVLFPVILLCIGSIIAGILTLEITKDTQMDQIYEIYRDMGMNFTPDEIREMAEGLIIFFIAATPFLYIAVWAIVTLILYVIYRLVKCEKGLKKYFSMTAYVFLITIVGDLIQALFVKYINGAPLNEKVTSIASLLDPGMAGSILYSVASSLEIFNIWAFVLFGIGFVYVGGVEKKKAYVTTAFLFIVTVFLSWGFSTLAGSLASLL